MYSTGELAKLCGVSVRTVQYYDSRNILTPSELSEGGRRLYSDDDLKKMKLVCFLRDAGFSIKNIETLFSDKESESIISSVIKQRENTVKEEISRLQKQLDTIESVKKGLNQLDSYSLESIMDIAYVLEGKYALKRLRLLMVFLGLPLEFLQWFSVVYWITNGVWWPFALWITLTTIFGVIITAYYFKKIAFLCPECHRVFTAPFKDVFTQKHTPTMRFLTCPCCGHKGYCIEVMADNIKYEKGNQ